MKARLRGTAVGAAATLAVLAMATSARPAAAQEATETAEVRVLETVKPATGRRTLHVMEALSPDEIRAVQRALADRGYGAPWREGTLDPFTRGALQSFQTRRGLPVCACVSLATLIELGLRVRVAETVVLEEPAGPAREERPAEAAPDTVPVYVNYGTYFPYGVVYLAPFVSPHHDPLFDPVLGGPGVAGVAGRGFAIGARVGGAYVGAAATAAPAWRPLGPFPRVSPPRNVVRGGG